MKKAYDTFLQSEVSSNLAAKNRGFEPYRYECSHCGEEVRLAATNSTLKAPHFRHRSGNNDIECEKYLGQYGMISLDSSSRKSKNERIEFYFDNTTKMFYLGLCFSNNEIQAYEQEGATFELRDFTQEQLFFSLRINNKNFDPDISKKIPIEKFAYNYFTSNSSTGIRRKYELFKGTDNSVPMPTFFKIQKNDRNFNAKLVRSTILYTNVPYFVAFQSQHTFSQYSFLLDGIKVDDTFQFVTMGRKFFGKVLTIIEKTDLIDSLITSWGYQLETSEILTLLWPPTFQRDETSVVLSDNAFIFSSFELEAHGNINIHSENIKKIEKGISKVLIESKIKIYRKNTEIVICKDEGNYCCFDSLKITESYQNIYTVQNKSKHFLFNRSGVIPLCLGQSILLTPDCVIKYYQFSYLEGCVYPKQQYKPFGKQLLDDLLAHYKRTEDFTIDIFRSLDLSEVAFQYIQSCDKLGIINSAAKYFIKKGWL